MTDAIGQYAEYNREVIDTYKQALAHPCWQQALAGLIANKELVSYDNELARILKIQSKSSIRQCEDACCYHRARYFVEYPETVIIERPRLLKWLIGNRHTQQVRAKFLCKFHSEVLKQSHPFAPTLLINKG